MKISDNMHRRLLAILSGVLLALAFPSHPDNPVALLYGGLWGWVATVPLLIALVRASGRVSSLARAFRLGFLAGFVFHLLSLYWIGHTQGGGLAVVGGAVLGAAWLSLYTGGFAVVVTVIFRRVGPAAVLMTPVAWTSMEYLLSLGELGFPWLLLAHSQAGLPVLIQYASVTGAYGVSFAMVLTSALLAAALESAAMRSKLLIAAAVIPSVTAIAGLWLMQPEPRGQVQVALVQNNMGLEKWQAGGLHKSVQSLADLSRQGLETTATAPHLFVWPETAIPCNLGWQPGCQRLLHDVAAELNTPVLTGAPDTDTETQEPYNAAFLFQPHSRDVPTYAKMHLVPFGERTPWRDDLPLLRDIDWSALTGDLGPAEFARGTTRTLFPLAIDGDVTRFAVLICFESVFPDLVRRSVDAGADLLVIITNDSWFGATAGPFQHAGIAVLRAVENRTAIARCATNGISLFIDRFGRTRLQTELGTADVRVSDVVRRQGSTFYTRHGDLFAGANLLLSMLMLVAARFLPTTGPKMPRQTERQGEQ